MYKILKLILVFLILSVFNGSTFSRLKLGRLCSPEKGQICIHIRECPFFVQLLDSSPIPRPAAVIKIIRNHQCGIDRNEPKVCCTILTRRIDNESFLQPQNIISHPNIKLLNNEQCGKIPNNHLITNGETTTLMEFPWMALLAYYTDVGITFKCGGTLITKRYVLTAAHCIVNMALAGVRLGEYDIDKDIDCDSQGICSPPVQDFFIEEIIVHSGYKLNSFEHDIALVRLASTANLTNANVKTICLPIGHVATTNLDKNFLVIAGWGMTENGYKSSLLMKASVPVIANEECKKIGNSYKYVTEKQICAGGFLGRDSCGGDSGGPLKYLTYENGVPVYVQYGIVSFGPTFCGLQGMPGVYTNIVYYMSWILDYMR